MNRIKVMLDDGAFPIERAHEADAGYDIRAPKSFTVAPYTHQNGAGTAVIDTGVHIAIPEGYAGFLKSKSGLNVKSNILSDGLIDSGYTGSIVVKLYNHGNREKHFDRGDKISQIVILPVHTPKVDLVNFLDDTDRGDNGFGSTGK